jgi:cell division protein ZapA (FtsZ GTPase activity inhibitor)
VDRIIRILLFGQAYEFRADRQLVHAEKIADHVVQEVEKAQSSASLPGKLETVILAALNIANNYFEMKERCDNLSRDIEQRCKTLIDSIDANP